MHVLVADDYDANCLLARTILERAGHSVDTVQNGLLALNMTKHVVYDLIILDIVMPVLDGVNALKRIRQEDSKNKNTLVFALTAYCDPEDRKRYSLAGFDAFLSKPLRKGDLERALEGFEDHNGSFYKSFTETKPPKQVQILDEDMIQLLLNTGSPERLLEIQSWFWTSIHRQCGTIKTCLPAVLNNNKQSLSEFRRAVHAIKGASASIGLSRVAHISRLLQNAPHTEIPELMRAFVKDLSEGRLALEKALSRTRELDTPVQMGREDEAEAPHHGQNNRSAIGN